MCCQIVLLACLVWPIPPKANDVLPLSGLAPAKYQKDLCRLTYRISTQSEECQKLFDQGLGYYYSYVWTEAARSFETALRHDPQCPMAWWGLSRALQQWGAKSGKSNDALKKAYDLSNLASYSEKQLILARAMERGIAKDQPISYRDVELPVGRLCDRLRAEQTEHFAMPVRVAGGVR